MRTYLMILFAAVWLGLAGCQPSAAETAPATEAAASSETAALPPTGPGCTAVSDAAASAPNPLMNPQPGDWTLGPDDAYVTFVVYSDFQCAYCAAFAPALAFMQQNYPEDVRIVYRHFPLIGTAEEPLNDKSALAMLAAEAAGRQGKFWEMHDILYGRYTEWATETAGLTSEAFEVWLLERAAELELDTAQFAADLTSPELAAQAEAAWEAGLALGIPSAPFALLNGQSLNLGEQMDIILQQAAAGNPNGLSSAQVSSFFYLILNYPTQLTLLEPRQFHECPPLAVDPSQTYLATLHTEKGDIVIRLLPEAAPFTVSSFLFLVEQGWYNGVTFHRVLPGFVSQTGDPSGTGSGNPGYYFGLEVESGLTFDRPGLVAMAHAGPTTNGSQFFITHGPAEHLNGQYTIFGEVISGLDVALNLTPRDPSSNPAAAPGDIVLSITVSEQ